MAEETPRAGKVTFWRTFYSQNERMAAVLPGTSASQSYTAKRSWAAARSPLQ